MTNEEKMIKLESVSLNDLYTKYEQLDLQLEDRKKEIDNILKQRSEMVRRISESVSPKKKIMKDGKQLSIVRRGDTYFFRGGKEDSVVEIT